MRCRKKSYLTPVDAMLAIQRVQRSRDVDSLEKHERTFYFCVEHGAYHLTSLTEWHE